MGTPDFSTPGYHILCLNTPYLDYLIAQVEEVCKNYDADGIFLDIVSVRPCYCSHCRKALYDRGLDPYNDDDALALAEEVYANYTRRVREAIDKYKPGLPVFHNGGHIRQGRRDLAYIDTECDFNDYKVIILPDLIEYNEIIAKKLKDFVANGGKLLATGKSGLDAEGKAFMFDFGAKYIGENPYQPDYFRPNVKIDGLGDTGYLVYSKGERIELAGGVELLKREDPYFNRTKEHF